jgi:hypothetical protein
MAYNTKAIKTDVNAKPIPQYYNPVTDEYEVLQGVDGATRQVLYGPDGNPISTTEGKLAVRAAELEEKLEAIRVLLNSLAGKDFATQTTLAQILAKMIAAPATEAKQDMIAGHVDDVETLLTALTGKDFATQTTLAQILGKMIAAPATEAKQDVIAGHVDGVETLLTALKEKDFATETKLEAVRVLLNSLAGEDFATSAKQAEILAALGKQSTAAKQDALAGLVGALDAEAVSDPAAAGAVIALLKGLLSRLQTLENKIDSFTTGEETVNTELKGSLIEDEQAVPIRYPAMEKRYTEYDNYVLPAGASIDRSIYEDIKGFRYVNLVLWRDDTTIPVRIQLYSRGLLSEWFNNTIVDIGAGQKIVSIIDYPIIPTTWMYVINRGDTAVTLKGIAIKART